MLIVGITGSLGTGKSTVSAMFKEHGAKIIDADAITRALISPQGKCIKKVAKNFPDTILKPSQELNRSQLAKIAFSHPLKLKKLTDILYPEALKQVKQQISQHKDAKLICLDVPLLFEAGWDRLTDVNIVVMAQRRQQVLRAKTHLGLSQADFNRRLKCQMPLKAKKALADIIVDNSQDLTKTRVQVDAIINRLLKRKK